MNDLEIIAPQEGFQTNFLSSSADIVIGGGAAGAGKSTALLLESMRHTEVQDYGGVIFRRSYPEIRMAGGLWDEAMKLYPYIGGLPNASRMEWVFEDKSKVMFRHMSDDRDVLNYQGAQITFIGFDELTHFSSHVFFYMLSRNRSTCGIKPLMRATCNPDPDSWVADFISWWIDPESGFPIMSRAGKLRYFIRNGDNLVWGNTKREVLDMVPNIVANELFKDINPEDLIKSVTFIPGTIKDNPILTQKDPQYLANLMAQDEQTKMRLLEGNWRVRVDKANLFDFVRINDIFANDLTFNFRDEFYISIDHAREGKDLCVIGTWNGWNLVRIDILKRSDTNDIVRVVRQLRRIYRGVPPSQIVVDQDGIGVKDALNCEIYQGNTSAIQTEPGVTPNFKNLNTQAYYHLADKVNRGQISVDLNNVWLHESELDYYKISTITLRGKQMSIKEMIRDELRIVKREAVDKEMKKQITSKDLRKQALGGRSTDFSDMMALRSLFDLLGQPFYLRQ